VAEGEVSALGAGQVEGVGVGVFTVFGAVAADRPVGGHEGLTLLDRHLTDLDVLGGEPEDHVGGGRVETQGLLHDPVQPTSPFLTRSNCWGWVSRACTALQSRFTVVS